MDFGISMIFRKAFKIFFKCVVISYRRQKIDLISDSQLGFVLLNTVFAHSLKWDENRKMFLMDLSDMNNFTLFEVFLI